MTGRSKTIASAALALAAVAGALHYFGFLAPAEYEACGTFFYGHRGHENVRVVEWSGAATISSFMDNLWDRRAGFRFFEYVWQTGSREYRWDRSMFDDVSDAYRTVTVWGSPESLTWLDLRAVSRDPVLAAQVVNATMKAVGQFEFDLLEAEHEQYIGHLSRLRKCVQGENGRRRLDADIDAALAVDVADRAMVKVLREAPVPSRRMTADERAERRKILRKTNDWMRCRR